MRYALQGRHTLHLWKVSSALGGPDVVHNQVICECGWRSYLFTTEAGAMSKYRQHLQRMGARPRFEGGYPSGISDPAKIARGVEIILSDRVPAVERLERERAEDRVGLIS